MCALPVYVWESNSLVVCRRWEFQIITQWVRTTAFSQGIISIEGADWMYYLWSGECVWASLCLQCWGGKLSCKSCYLFLSVGKFVYEISVLLISMNHEYLTLMNITIFDEVSYKLMDPTSSQFVVVALVRAGMVYGNKFLWELLVFKKLWSISQEQNWRKQELSNDKRKLE